MRGGSGEEIAKGSCCWGHVRGIEVGWEIVLSLMTWFGNWNWGWLFVRVFR